MNNNFMLLPEAAPAPSIDYTKPVPVLALAPHGAVLLSKEKGHAILAGTLLTATSGGRLRQAQPGEVVVAVCRRDAKVGERELHVDLLEEHHRLAPAPTGEQRKEDAEGCLRCPTPEPALLALPLAGVMTKEDAKAYIRRAVMPEAPPPSEADLALMAEAVKLAANKIGRQAARMKEVLQRNKGATRDVEGVTLEDRLRRRPNPSFKPDLGEDLELSDHELREWHAKHKL